MRTTLLAALGLILVLGLFSVVRRVSTTRQTIPEARPHPASDTLAHGPASEREAPPSEHETVPDTEIMAHSLRQPTVGRSLVGRPGYLPTSAIAEQGETVIVNRPFGATTMMKVDPSTAWRRVPGMAGPDIYTLQDTIVPGSHDDRLVVAVDSAGIVRCISQNVFLRFRPFHDSLVQWIGRGPDSAILNASQSRAFWWNDTLLVTLDGDRSGYILNSWLRLQRIPRRPDALPSLSGPC